MHLPALQVFMALPFIYELRCAPWHHANFNMIMSAQRSSGLIALPWLGRQVANLLAVTVQAAVGLVLHTHHLDVSIGRGAKPASPLCRCRRAHVQLCHLPSTATNLQP